MSNNLKSSINKISLAILESKMNDLVRIPALAPFEMVRLPDELNGLTGSNRVENGKSQIAAQNDVDAIKAWLARFADTKTTFESYRKDSHRVKKTIIFTDT